MMGTSNPGSGTGKGKKSVSPAPSRVPGPGSPAPGTLYVVATPIGNLEDITFRAARILREVGLVAAEDTRHTRKLLSHLGISKELTSYFDHNRNIKGRIIIDRLSAGDSVALVTDAGTPCISDPGYQLVEEAREAGVKVVPVPGPSSVVTALSASGAPADKFVFEGFLPPRLGKRREALASLKGETRTVVFFESPKRLRGTLIDIMEVLGDREIIIARELTKIYEEFLRGKVSALLERMGDAPVKGEVVVILPPWVVSGEEPDILSLEEVLDRLLFVEGRSVKEAARLASAETGCRKNEAYAAALALVAAREC